MDFSQNQFDHDKSPSMRSARHRLTCLQRVIEGFAIGSRIRVYPALEQCSLFQSSILGHCFGGEFVLDFKELQADRTYALGAECGAEAKTLQPSLDRATDFQLVISYDPDVKLQTDTMDAVPAFEIDVGTRLVVMSTSANHQNQCVETVVQQHYYLGTGAHVGRQVLLLKVILGSLQSYQARSQPRVKTYLPVVAWLGDMDIAFSAVMLDFSERALRLSTIGNHGDWPTFGKDLSVIIEFVPDVDKPVVKLECQLLFDRGDERVYQIQRIYRKGEFVPFDSIDALGIKLDLLNFVGGEIEQ